MKHAKEKHLFVEDDVLVKVKFNMKQEILNWWMRRTDRQMNNIINNHGGMGKWCLLTDKERFKIIEEEYANW